MREGVAVVVGLVMSFALAKPVTLLLSCGQVVDVPNPRSSHVVATPRGGGFAVLGGLALGLAAGSASQGIWGIFVVAVLAAVLGFADDLRGLPAVLRLALQVVLAVAATWWMLRDVDGSTAVVLVWAALGTIWLMSYLNAFNFMDGINGISAVSAACAGAWFLIVGHTEELDGLAIGGAAMLGASAGFLPWNAPRARVFLGDVGSYGIGLFVGCLAVIAVAGGVHPFVAAAPLLVYLADTGWTLAGRIIRREPLLEAHREHIYQRLSEEGTSTHVQVTGLVLVTTAALCAAAWLLPVVPALGCCLIVLGLYVGSPRILKTLH